MTASEHRLWLCHLAHIRCPNLVSGEPTRHKQGLHCRVISSLSNVFYVGELERNSLAFQESKQKITKVV